ncbi:MAG: HAD-IC family P-type ATPase [Magnetospirillum sp. WYHS-4]
MGVPLWHSRTAEEARRLQGSGPAGLSESEAAARLARFGPNELPSPPRDGLLVLFLRQFKSPLIYLLMAAAGVSVAIGEASDASFIAAVLLVNAAIGAIQEWKAESGAEALKAMIRIRAVVLRDGVRHLLDAAALVPGDLVVLEAGSVVPADLRLLSGQDLLADESLLTGESLPVDKDAGLVLPEAAVLGDRRNMLFAGTVVASGRAEGLVVQTASHTELGRIAQAMARTQGAVPPLVQRLERFSAAIGWLVVAATAILGLAMIAKGEPPAHVFLVAVALAVAAIPEGLPVAITVALSVGSARMARRRVIVRSLPAAESLGACTCIASDKTGTLTCNELTVRRLWLPGVGEIEVEGEGYHPVGRIRAPEGSADAVRRLAEAGLLCNDATFRPDGQGGWHRFGDTVDVAFLVLGAKLGLTRDPSFQEEGRVPFDSRRRFAASFHRHAGELTAQVKGAAETVIPMCRDIDAAAVLTEVERLAAGGYRVLAVAAGRAAEASGDSLADLEFLGLAGLIDPLRPGARAAVERCRRAGIDVRMVTGDHPATALAIAAELGIAGGPGEVVTGAELAELRDDPAGFDEAVRQAKVFARVEPVQKLGIVQSLQRAGHFVAVTGDGVNDAPALRAAHIGVAMGKDGTDVARGAAGLIIADDDFASIVNGVEEGRIAYDNVRKVVYFLITAGVGELALFLLSFLAGLPVPLFAAQLLWLNLVTNGIQHVALSVEKGEDDILDRAPRPPEQPIFDRRMIEQVTISGLFVGTVAAIYFAWALDSGMPETEARNALLLLMVVFGNVQAFNCRSERRPALRHSLLANPFLMAAVPAAHLVHIGAAYLPGLSSILRIEPLSFSIWIAVLPLALCLILAMDAYKIVNRRLGRDV